MGRMNKLSNKLYVENALNKESVLKTQEDFIILMEKFISSTIDEFEYAGNPIQYFLRKLYNYLVQLIKYFGFKMDNYKCTQFIEFEKRVNQISFDKVIPVASKVVDKKDLEL